MLRYIIFIKYLTREPGLDPGPWDVCFMRLTPVRQCAPGHDKKIYQNVLK